MFLLIPGAIAGVRMAHSNLHSNMFLLILIPYSKIYENLIHLHSNMFLLIQRLQKQENITDWDLHSNMFLLILVRIAELCSHNLYLHSNMFLLIRLQCQDWHLLHTNLHSNMFLLIHKIFIRNNGTIQIYIPICFY